MSSDNEDDQSSTGKVKLNGSTGDEKEKRAKITRFRWVPMTRIIVEHGKLKNMYPFLDRTNKKDLYLVRQILADVPYKSTHGLLLTAWDKVAATLNVKLDPEGQPIYSGCLRGKTAQSRFNQYMEFMEKEWKDAPPTPLGPGEEVNEIRAGIEFMHQDQRAHLETLEKQREELRNKPDKRVEKMLQRVSMVAPPTNSVLSENDQSVVSVPPPPNYTATTTTTTTTTRAAVAATPPPLAASTNTSSTSPNGRTAPFTVGVPDYHTTTDKQERFKRRQERYKAKEVSKRAKYDLEKHRLRLEEERLKFEKEKFDKQVQERADERKAQAEERLATLKLLESITKSFETLRK